MLRLDETPFWDRNYWKTIWSTVYFIAVFSLESSSDIMKQISSDSDGKCMRYYQSNMANRHTQISCARNCDDPPSQNYFFSESIQDKFIIFEILS